MNNQYEVFGNMISTAITDELHKSDFEATCRQMEISEDGNELVVNGQPYVLEQDAFTQMIKSVTATKNGRNNAVAVSDYLWNNKQSGIMQYAVQKHLDSHPKMNFLVRTYDNTLRALLSPNYAIMNNAAVIMRVAAIINDNNMVNDDFRVVESNVARDSLRIKLLFTEYDAGDYGTGIYFTNNELGNGSIAFHSLVKRAFCDNSLISADNMSLYHRGAINERLFLIEPELIASVNYSGNLLKLLNNSRKTTYTPEQHATIIEALQERYTLSDDFVERMAVGSEGERNLWGVVNGITYAAKECKDREHYEQIAAKIMNKYLK